MELVNNIPGLEERLHESTGYRLNNRLILKARQITPEQHEQNVLHMTKSLKSLIYNLQLKQEQQYDPEQEPAIRSLQNSLEHIDECFEICPNQRLIPKITVFADTNCFTNNNHSPQKQALTELIKDMESDEYYELHKLPIVKKELLPHGIKHKELDIEELKGLTDFKDLFKGTYNPKADLELFFTITYDYIKKLQEDITHVMGQSNWRQQLKEKGHQDIDRITNRFYQKLRKNIITKNTNNLFADAIIASCGLMYNMFKHGEYGLIMTGDEDIKLIENMLLEYTLPQYMAQMTIRKYPKSEKYPDQKERTKKLEDNAREHIKYFQNLLQKHLEPVASIYNYRTGEIHTYRMSIALIEFIRGSNPYIHLKTEFINTMTEKELTVEDAYALLEKGITHNTSIKK